MLLSVPLALFLLRRASHADSWRGLLAAGVAFSFVNNTVFALLHESVHGTFHARRWINEWAGRVTAAFLPTGLGFQRICHLGHHRRNRSDVELFDYYLPEDNRTLKTVQWYGILTGVYWLLSPVACLLYLACPRMLTSPALRGQSRFAVQTSADAMLSGFDDAPSGTIRLEIVFSLALQLAAAWTLDLSFAGWGICYALFAVNWSSLQYSDHAWSPRDARSGAWNLKVTPVVQALFLNYHHHQAHHENPQVPWIHLPKYVDFSRERPSFVEIYLRMWGGPRSLDKGRS